MTSPKKERTAQCLAAEDAANDVDSSDQLNEMLSHFTLPLLAGIFCWLRLHNRIAWGSRYDKPPIRTT